MKNNKQAIWITTIISIFSLIISVSNWHISLFNFKNADYWSNLFLGIFTSGLLTLMISIINYRNEKRKTLEKFYVNTMKVIKNIYFYIAHKTNDNIDYTIDLILEISKFDYTELDNAYGDISFMFNNKKNTKYIFEDIYNPICEFKNLISFCSFHFNEYKSNTSKNKKAIQMYLNKIDNLIFTAKKNQTTSKCSNNIANAIFSELEGRYYNIMYPHIKKAN